MNIDRGILGQVIVLLAGVIILGLGFYFTYFKNSDLKTEIDLAKMLTREIKQAKDEPAKQLEMVSAEVEFKLTETDDE